MTASVPHHFGIKVLASDIDFMGHVNNANYLRWVQDAVIDHWRSIAPPEAIARHLWVALKHEITYFKPTFLGDEVVVSAALERLHGARAFYQAAIRRGEEVVAQVKSTWCCVDAQTFKPSRLKRDVVSRFFS